MNRLTFTKMTGSGNDFIFIDGRIAPAARWRPDRIRDHCRRGTGIGADGLIVLEPGSATNRVRFNFYNSDGRRSAMCGNGALCAARMALEMGLASDGGLILETDAGEYDAKCVQGSRDRSTLWLQDVTGIEVPNIPLSPGESSVHFATVGVPHLVVRVNTAPVRFLERGPELRRHPALAPDGANVNFVWQEEDSWRMRTYERGVEAETLACGTGAVASAAALAVTRQIDLPWTVVTSSGCHQTISGDPDPGGLALRSPTLTGEGRIVFRGELAG